MPEDFLPNCINIENVKNVKHGVLRSQTARVYSNSRKGCAIFGVIRSIFGKMGNSKWRHVAMLDSYCDILKRRKCETCYLTLASGLSNVFYKKVVSFSV